MGDKGTKVVEEDFEVDNEVWGVFSMKLKMAASAAPPLKCCKKD